MNFPFFRSRPEANPADASPAPPPAPPPRGLSRLLARFRRRRPEQGPAAETPDVPDIPPPPPSRLPAPLLALWAGLARLFGGVDEALQWLAVPFGVHVSSPRRRYAILLGLFAGAFLLGSLPVPVVPLVALGIGYLGVLAIGRAWVRNEQRRTAIVKKLDDANPDELPDLRGTALVSSLLLLVLFPLLFQQAHRQFDLFVVRDEATFWDWLWFSLDKTYLKALPDWSILYGVHISSIDFEGAWGRHLVFLARLTVDYILIQGVFRLLAIRSTIREAVAAVKTDPDLAVRLGRRAIPALVEKLRDPDRAVRGAAANALIQLGDETDVRPFLPAAPADGSQPAR